MAFDSEESPIERKLALLALQKRDSSIKSILTHAPHAVLFHLNHSPLSGDPTPTWEKVDIEGLLYLVNTVNGQFRLMLLDSDQPPSGIPDYAQGDVWTITLTQDVVAEQHGHTLHLRTANSEVFAIWFTCAEVADRVCSYVGSILSARPLPSPPSPSDLLKMILAQRAPKVASTTPYQNDTSNGEGSAQGSEQEEMPPSSSVPSVEGSNSCASLTSNSNIAAGQHILSLLKGSGKNTTPASTEAVLESPTRSNNSHSSRSAAEEEGPEGRQGVTMDTFQMLEAELSKASPCCDEEDDDDCSESTAGPLEGICVTRSKLRQALVDVVSSDAFLDMFLQRLSSSS